MGLIWLEKINHINSKNHKIIQNCPKPSNTRQNHKESTKYASTHHKRLKRYLF